MSAMDVQAQYGFPGKHIAEALVTRAKGASCVCVVCVCVCVCVFV